MPDVSLALIYQAEALHQHLKGAFAEFGGKVVYESPANRFDAGALDASGAQVVVINLDPEASDEFEALGDLLADTRRRVVFNDGEVTSRLEGWDLARWTRHLAAKVLGVDDVNPPRPAGAQAVPIRVKASAPAGGEGHPGESFELQGHELAAALAADTGSAIERTRAALVTADEPVAPKLVPKPPAEPRYDFDPAELTMHLPDAAAAAAAPRSAAPGDAPTMELKFDPAVTPSVSRRELPTLELSLEAQMLETPPAAVPRPAAPARAPSPPAAEPTLELSLDDAPELPARRMQARQDEPTLDLGFDALEAASMDSDSLEAVSLDSDSLEAAVPMELEAAAEPDFGLGADELSLADEPATQPQQQRPTAGPIVEENEISFTDEEMALALPDFDADAPMKLPSAQDTAADTVPDDFGDALKDFGFLEDQPDKPREDVVDLDTLLSRAGQVETQKKGLPGPAARAAAAPAPTPAAPAKPAAAPAPAPAAKAPAAPAPAKPAAAPAPAARPAAAPVAASARPGAAGRSEAPAQKTLADFESALAGLSLAPLDDAPAPPPPKVEAAAAPAAAKEAPAPAAKAAAAGDFSGALAGLSLEPVEGEIVPPSAPITGRAVFKVPEIEDKKPAPPPPPPPAPAASPAEDMLSLEGFDFNFDENVEIKTDSIVRLGTEAALDDMSIDLDNEIEHLLAREAQLSAVVDAPIKRVWVLGASIGGPDAVREFLAALPPDVPAVFLLAQHMGADFLELMVQQLGKASRLRVRTAVNGESVNNGEIVVVPLAERVLIDATGVMRIVPMEKPSPYTPSIDAVIKDAADAFGKAAGVIIFSGMAHDAIEGAKYIKSKGGLVWVQDPNTCVISSMVDGAREAGVVSFTGAPAALAQQFLKEHGR